MAGQSLLYCTVLPGLRHGLPIQVAHAGESMQLTHGCVAPACRPHALDAATVYAGQPPSIPLP